jgi:hypothetical protein
LPVGRDPILDQVAQTIADEYGTTGSIHSAPRDLAIDLGYPVWADNSQRVLSSAFVMSDVKPPSAIALQWKGQIGELVRKGEYREIGIGIADYVAGSGGTAQTVYVIVMGSQPNVLPVIINAGEDTVYEQEVLLYLHNERSLSFQTDDETVQAIATVKIANSEDELADADELAYADNNFAIPWELTEDFGEKSVWVEFTDAKGATTRYEATVEFADPETKPADTITETDDSISLVMTYGGDTFTLQLDTDAESVNLQEVYFTWLNDLRAYELENAQDLFSVNLENFNAAECIQVRVRGNSDAVSVEGCSTVYVEANEFIDLVQVFWNPEFGEFKVYDGQTLLGSCDTHENQCEIDVN